MFLIESQEGTVEDMEKYAAQRGLTFPIALRHECDFVNYDANAAQKLPYAFVIGPDGKVAWQGKHGYEAAVAKELKRLKYPALRRMDVDTEVVPAAEAFEAGEYGKAFEEASKVLEDGESADADYVVKKIKEHVAELREQIDAAKDSRRYHEAVAMLEQLSGKPYKGLEACDLAKDELKELKKDKQVKAELKAWDKLEKTLEDAEDATPENRIKLLEKFAERNEGTAAAEEAKTLAEGS